ncbi:hypothetical protein CBM00_05840 [Klebsiella pneumoniae]|nr:hypothetical protein CBL56_03440 [Klebsiella pneumoniae]OXP28311.1 hypothetical protein CBL51_08445 [Klebsiella pneumoniae]OXP45264.1 hypothetical protein CBL62_08780 [Klebsiella pneumoniae]OXP45386.1 hypothetical protein CBL76_16160 [Klebsiella pneumoniae]OXP64183.1 hypothetical protein CBL75_07125 [Klebsiella pneumoniae]
MMSLWDALRMNMMISYQELVRTFLKENRIHLSSLGGTYSKFDNTNPLKFPPASKKQQADKKT